MKHVRLFIHLLLIGFPMVSLGQMDKGDTLLIKGMLKINKGKELKVKAGTIMVFEPGASIWVDGSLWMEGTEKQSILCISSDPKEPGTGIIINGSDPNGKISIQQTKFESLSRPLSFEPFWFRKSVHLTQLHFQYARFSESLVYIASPLVNLNSKAIQFDFSDCRFNNNSAGVLIENAGSSGIIYNLNNLLFINNEVSGNDPSLGVLHLNLGTPFIKENLVLGKLAFIDNYSGAIPIGISLSGNEEKVMGAGIFRRDYEEIIYDSRRAGRLPSLEAPLSQIKNYDIPLCYLNEIKHTSGIILLKGKLTCSVEALLDSNEHKIEFSQVASLDSVSIQYPSAHPFWLRLSNGLIYPIPPIELDTPQVLAAAINLVENTDSLVPKAKPWIPSHELGLMGGLAFYVGDIKHRFGIPGVYDWSSTLFYQYNKSPKLSYRFGFSRTNIGMHNPTAALMIWQSADTYGSKNGETFVIPSYYNNFKTKLYNLDFDVIYYFAKNNNEVETQLKEELGYWIPALGAGASLCYFEPYRMVVYSRYRDTAEFMKLRPLGLEGQNFLTSKRDYLPITLNVNVSIQLAYAYKKWRFRYEFKAIMSFSDYLDDYGQGFAYGGNYEEWEKNVGDVDLPVSKYTGEKITLEQAFPKYESDTKRTTNLLPDMYFPQHVGVSYVF